MIICLAINRNIQIYITIFITILWSLDFAGYLRWDVVAVAGRSQHLTTVRWWNVYDAFILRSVEHLSFSSCWRISSHCNIFCAHYDSYMRLILGILGNLHHWANLHHCHQRPSPPGVLVFSNAGNARNPCKIKIVNFSIPLAFVSASLLEENWLRWQIVSIRWQNPNNITSSEARCHVYHPSDPAYQQCMYNYQL